MGLLQIVKQQCVGKHWEWVPWKRILSEAVSQEARARRAADSHNDLLHLVADSMGVLREERGPDNVQSAYRIQCLLETRANAFAMCGACHLGSWTLYNKKFLAYYTKKVGDTYRGPSGAEAEEADHVAVQEVFDLCFAGCSMDDALHQVSVERDILRHLLVSVPKPMRSDRPKGRAKALGKASR